MNLSRKLLGLMALCCCTLTTALAAGTTALWMASDSGDYIGGGITQTLNSPDYAFVASTNYDGGVNISVNNTSSSSYVNWTLSFAAPVGTTFGVGKYDQATRFPFQAPTAPGLDVSGDGRGCNVSKGFFVVRDYTANNGSVQSFAADFIQHCEDGTAKLTGAVRYNSTVPLIPTAPVALAPKTQQIDAGATVSLDGSDSVAYSGKTIASYAWTQLSGPAVQIANANAATASFTAPSLSTTQTLVFQLTITDSAGQSDTTTQAVTVNGSNAPKTELYLASDSGDYIGSGITQTITASDGSFSLSGTTGHVHVSLNNGAYWSLDFAAPNGSQLVVGNTYANATRYPFQSPTAPGLDVSGDGRGCNVSQGVFVIRDLSLDSQGNISTFAADFQQHCEDGVPKLAGAIRYNSTIPTVSTAPVAIASANSTLYAQQNETLDGTQSFAQGSAKLVGYSWKQTSGPNVSLVNANSASATFTAPAWSSDQTLTFQLTVTDSTGATAMNSVTVTVKGADAAESLFSYSSDAGDYIGGGGSLTDTPSNGQFSISGSTGAVQVSVNDGNYWSLSFAAPTGSSLQVGTTYSNTARYPSQGAAPGLDVSGAGRGCNTSTGSFTVNQLVVGSGGSVISFAADFVQHCEGAAPALHGTVKYNAMPYSFTAQASGPRSALTLTANVQVAPADLGKQGQIYVAAMANGRLYFHTGGGWVPVFDTNYPAYSSGALANTTVPIVSNLDVTAFSNVSVYVGYGYSVADMLAAKRYSLVYSF